MQKKVYLIDGNSFIYRMFFALPEFSTKDGRVVNATFGMAKFFVGQLVKEKPDYIVFIKDAKGKNFRHDLYSEYKATRERMPDSLRSQMNDIDALISKMNIEIISISGYEADDVIGTLAVELGKTEKFEIFILSGDKDLYALVNERVSIYDTQRKKISGPTETYNKFGVPAECVRDYLAICGDTSDNIPGIAGIGPKKATVLLNYFGSLEKIYEIVDNFVASFLPVGENGKRAVDNNLDGDLPEEVQKILKGKTLEKFIDGKENAFLSQKLATLDCGVTLPDFEIEEFAFNPKSIFTPELSDFFRELEFSSLLFEQEVVLQTWKDVGAKVNIVGDTQGLDELWNKIGNIKEIVLDTETTSLNVREAELVGVSILLSEKEIYYINHLHPGPQVSTIDLQNFIKNIIESDILIIGHNIKYDLQILEHFLQEKSMNTQKDSEPSLGQTSLVL
ncbi:hypothetical protein N9J72_00420 [Candidatus Gracilibacteria bacterium]|nr:hypothetical protein [Candidatus Gracilibacteria bacterium]